MKSGITRWKLRPSEKPRGARLTKLATVRGALSGYSSTLIGPRSVSKTAFRDMGCLVGVGCPADMRAEGRDSIGPRRMRLRHRSKVYYPAPSTLIVAQLGRASCRVRMCQYV